jgi:hypothetical protein
MARKGNIVTLFHFIFGEPGKKENGLCFLRLNIQAWINTGQALPGIVLP